MTKPKAAMACHPCPMPCRAAVEHMHIGSAIIAQRRGNVMQASTKSSVNHMRKSSQLTPSLTWSLPACWPRWPPPGGWAAGTARQAAAGAPLPPARKAPQLLPLQRPRQPRQPLRRWLLRRQSISSASSLACCLLGYGKWRQRGRHGMEFHECCAKRVCRFYHFRAA